MPSASRFLPLLPAAPADSGGSARLTRLFARLSLLAAWAINSWDSLAWLVRALAREEQVVQRMLLIALGGMAVIRVLLPADPSRIHPRAGAIALAGVVLATLVHASTDIHFVQAAAALCLLHAVSALFLDAERWQRQWSLLAIVLICLPIQPHIDAYLGLPLRLWTAGVVAPLLQTVGVASATVESIVVTEGSVADVASVCSGVRTLWYAVALWLGARLFWPQAARRRWWLAGVLSVTLAVACNTLRVFLLVLALHHHAVPFLVDLAHASMGLLALCVVGGINVWLCATDPLSAPISVDDQPPALWQHGAIVLLLLASAAIPSARPDAGKVSIPAHLLWPSSFDVQPLALSPSERDLVLGRGSRVAEKHRFTWQGTQGSLLVVESSNWRAQHAPELCLIAQGARISDVTRVATPAGDFRVVRLDGGQQTAITWFQSGADIVPDLAARLWAQLRQRERDWTMVTLVVDGELTSAQTIGLQSAVWSVVAYPASNSVAAMAKESS